MVARLTAMGGSLDCAIKQREYGRTANMADPFGNGFDLTEFSSSGYDAASRFWAQRRHAADRAAGSVDRSDTVYMQACICKTQGAYRCCI